MEQQHDNNHKLSLDRTPPLGGRHVFRRSYEWLHAPGHNNTTMSDSSVALLQQQ